MDNMGFKTKVFGGFNKKQVLDYIDQMHAEAAKNAAVCEENLKRFAEIEQELNEKLNAAQKENSTLSQQLEAALGSEKALREELNKKTEEYETAAEDNKRLAELNMQMKVKCDKYDNINDRIGSILIDAKNIGEKILDDARQEADRIKSAAADEAEQAGKNTILAANEFDSQLDTLSKEFERMRAQVSEMSKDIDNKLKNLNNLIDESKNTYKPSVDKLIGRQSFFRSAAETGR